MSDLGTMTARARVLLQDTSGARYSAAEIEEGLRHALAELGRALPLLCAADLAVTQTGSELALVGLSGLSGVAAVQYPLDPADPAGSPRLDGRTMCLWLEDGPRLARSDGGHFEAGQTARLTYTRPPRLAGLDGATATTLPPDAEALLVNGAAGFAASFRAVALSESFGSHLSDGSETERLAKRYLDEFRRGVRELRAARGRAMLPYAADGAAWPG